MSAKANRRRFLKGAIAAAAGTAVGLSLEEQALLAAKADRPGAKAGDGQAGAKAGDKQAGAQATDAERGAKPAGETDAQAAAAGALPTGTINGRTLSRIICGGNLISGFAHSRDLTYVSPLLKNYFTDAKVFETLHLCEQHGINTAMLRCDERVAGLLDRYWNKEGGKIQWLAQTYPAETGDQANIKLAVDGGAMAAYVQGGHGDKLVKEGRVDLIEKAVAFMRDRRLLAGVGGHQIDVPIAVEEAGIAPDFYVKTLHRTDYWSYTPERAKDNSWCASPEATIRFMQGVPRPWIAFKVLAAGAIRPLAGLRFAFENGADFACVGMFDFQVAEDSKTARTVLAGNLKRERPWRA